MAEHFVLRLIDKSGEVDTMEATEVTPEEFFAGILIFNLVVGCIGGLVPWVISNVRGNRIFGTVAFVLTLLGAMVFGILIAFPMMIVFSIIGALKWTED